MARTIYVKNTLQGLIPLYDGDYEEKKKSMKLGEIYEVQIKKPRNPKRHKLFFVLLEVGRSNVDIEIEREQFRQWLLLEVGYVDMYKTPSGKYQKHPKSMSFANCDEVEFNNLFWKCFDRIKKLLDVTDEDLEGAVNTELGEKMRGILLTNIKHRD